MGRREEGLDVVREQPAKMVSTMDSRCGRRGVLVAG